MGKFNLEYQWQIAGNRKALFELEKQYKNDRLAHAYLFSGPDQVGKYSVAQSFAKLLQCENKQLCRHCQSCRHIDNQAHLDTLQFRDDGAHIKIEQVRQMIAYLSISRQSNYKIVLVENVERMTNDAANALLKTLEEPVASVVIILTTSQISLILATLLSRCRIMPFATLDDEAMQAYLKEHYPEADEVRLARVRAFALGKVGQAIELMEKSELYNLYEEIFFKIEDFMVNENLQKRFEFADEISAAAGEQKGAGFDKVKIFFDVCLHMLRNYLFHRLGYVSQIEEMSHSRHKVNDLIELLKKTMNAQALMRLNVNQRLMVENLLMSF